MKGWCFSLRIARYLCTFFSYSSPYQDAIRSISPPHPAKSALAGGVAVIQLHPRMWVLAAFLQAGAILPAARLPAALTTARGTTSRPTGRAAVRQCAADSAPVQLWHVQLFNDDFNMREHVSRTLMMVASDAR